MYQNDSTSLNAISLALKTNILVVFIWVAFDFSRQSWVAEKEEKRFSGTRNEINLNLVQSRKKMLARNTVFLEGNLYPSPYSKTRKKLTEFL